MIQSKQALTESAIDSFILSNLVSVLRHRCQCDFQETFISQAMLLCQKEDPTQVVYRARITRYGTISATKLVGFIEEWVKQGASITTGILVVTFDSNCLIRISDIDEPICDQILTVVVTSSPTTNPCPPLSDTATIIASIVPALVLIIVMIIAVIDIFVYFVKLRNRK